MTDVISGPNKLNMEELAGMTVAEALHYLNTGEKPVSKEKSQGIWYGMIQIYFDENRKQWNLRFRDYSINGGATCQVPLLDCNCISINSPQRGREALEAAENYLDKWEPTWRECVDKTEHGDGGSNSGNKHTVT